MYMSRLVIIQYCSGVVVVSNLSEGIKFKLFVNYFDICSGWM